MNDKKFDVSLIFATIGNDSIFNIFEQLNNSEYIKKTQIIVSLPPDSFNFKLKVENYFNNNSQFNYKVFLSHAKGQVAQRSFAIKKNKSDIIIQLDDDLSITSDVIDSLIKEIKFLGPGYAIAPKISPAISFYSFPVLKKLLYIILYKRKNKNLTDGGILHGGIALYPSIFSDNHTEVEWLPGGCVCYHKSDALYDDYFPFKGKAYYEDVIASILRKKMHIKHFIINKEIVIAKPENITEFKSLIANLKARDYVVTLLEENYFLNFSKYIDIFLYFCRFLKKIFRNNFL